MTLDMALVRSQLTSFTLRDIVKPWLYRHYSATLQIYGKSTVVQIKKLKHLLYLLILSLDVALLRLELTCFTLRHIVQS